MTIALYFQVTSVRCAARKAATALATQAGPQGGFTRRRQKGDCAVVICSSSVR